MMIIFELILTTFKSSVILRRSWDSCENWFELKIDPPSGILACQNP